MKIELLNVSNSENIQVVKAEKLNKQQKEENSKRFEELRLRIEKYNKQRGEDKMFDLLEIEDEFAFIGRDNSLPRFIGWFRHKGEIFHSKDFNEKILPLLPAL